MKLLHNKNITSMIKSKDSLEQVRVICQNGFPSCLPVDYWCNWASTV